MTTRPHTHDPAPWRVLVGGMLGMAVALGIGRFAYTPILPLMKRDLGLSLESLGRLAAFNHLGYLAGAVVCAWAPGLLRRVRFVAGALALLIATTAAMPLVVSSVWWSGLRLAGGFASAVLFLAIAVEVSDSLAWRGRSHWLGGLYGGVGLGIALSGLVVPLLDAAAGWSGAWIGMGAVALVLGSLGLALGRRSGMTATVAEGPPTAPGPALAGLRLLTAAYTLAGLGYIVTATFLVAMVADVPGLAGFAPWSWVAVGVAAGPATVLWPLLARRYGNRPALAAAYAVQAAGILVSVVAESVPAALFAAASFGGTFLGIVSLTLAEGGRRQPQAARRAAAVLTTGFGVGQIIGPAVAGALADRTGGFGPPLLLAAGCVVTSGVLTLLDPRFKSRKPTV